VSDANLAELASLLAERDEKWKAKVTALQAKCDALADALLQINEWTCYASEENIEARLMALQQIDLHARAALAAYEATGEAE
jgi:hypothetical protein